MGSIPLLICFPANLGSRSPPISLHQANISNGAPSYSAEHLSELKDSTPSSRRLPIQDPYDADMSMDMDSTADFSMVAMDSSDALRMFLRAALMSQSDSYAAQSMTKVHL